MSAITLPAFPWTSEQHQQLLALCRRFEVLQLWIFGSAVKGTFDPAKSDLDFQVRFPEVGDPLERGGDVLDFWQAVEDLFGRRVDLLTVFPIRNPYLRADVEASRLLLYDATSQEISV